MCIDYLIEMRPEYLLEFAKSAITDDQKWQYHLAHITMQFDRIAQNRSQEFYETLLKGKILLTRLKTHQSLTFFDFSSKISNFYRHFSIFRALDHLDYLIQTKRLPDILNIIPTKYFSDGTGTATSNGKPDVENDSNSK